ncbi:MAG: phenylalanine--tRNA ligase subunit alpha [Candidatus Pacearchaeota archaeon]|jgi:phenylalanyl-tRNA synthetase alpha chain
MTNQKIIESLSPIERKIFPHLEEKNIEDICKKSNLDRTTVLRALEYLNKKEIIKLNFLKKKIIELGINGILYKRKGLPERILLNLLNAKRILTLKDAQKETKLSNDEFKASIGVLKKKALIELKNEKIIFNANKEEIAKKSLEEIFIENIPLDYDKLTPEQKFAFESLQKRKNIVEIQEKKDIKIEITELGKELLKSNLNSEFLIEQLSPEIIKDEKNWKGKKFRRYDINGHVPRIYGGKRHFVNSAIDYAREIWKEMGFKEMNGNIVQSSFWNFDALFTAQDHPVREMQDTFFLKEKTEINDKKIMKMIKEAHEKGVSKSKGWNYEWDEEEAKKLVLRTHTTCLSALKLYELKKFEKPEKFFAIGKCFRNETVDWSHGFEFNQTEGIVIDKNANFRHLLGYLKQFFKKMGFEKIRFTPAYFPYTEPSVEINVWHPEKNKWLELGGAGILRPEVVVPLLGEYIPVLAWGPGFDRILMDYYEIKDLRDLYKNDLTQLRNIKTWIK